jgi:guanylate cyclase
LGLKVPIYAAYLYDAVNVYARALFEAIDEGVDMRNGSAIANRIKGRTYESKYV